MTAGRKDEFDIMKGVAILCVMMGHTYWIPEWGHTFIHSFHMPLFFLISGYFAKTYADFNGDIKSFLRKNAKQLLIPYVIVACISCGYSLLQAIHYDRMSMFTHNVIRYVFALDETWTGTLFDSWVTPVWFLLALFWARLFFFYISKYEKWVLPVCLICSVAIILVHPYMVTPWCIGRGLEALMFIAIGWYVRRHKLPIYITIILIGCWLFSMYLGEIDLCALKFNCLPVDVLGACGGTLVIYYLAKLILKTPISGFFKWCGRNSLIILCAHTIEGSMTVIHLLTKLLPFHLPMVIYFGIKHIVALCGSWCYISASQYIKSRK